MPNSYAQPSKPLLSLAQIESSRPYRLLALAVLIVIAVVLSRHFVAEDGLIYSRYVANALHSQGLVFNAGEHVNALTSPLFSYLLLGVAWILHGDVILAEFLLFAVT